jgi:hypothetical protein
MNALKDDKGNWSSLRIGLLLYLLFLTAASARIYFDWLLVLMVEIQKDEPNYAGITELFNSMLIGFVGGVFVAGVIKTVQKYFETKNEKDGRVKTVSTTVHDDSEDIRG